MLLVAQVGGQAQIASPKIAAERQHAELAVLAVDAGFALALDRVETQAGAVIHAEPARDIDRSQHAAATLEAQRGFGQRLVGCPFGHDVDCPAEAAAARRGAVQEGAGAAQNLDPLDDLGREVLARQQSVQAVVGHVVREDRKATGDVDLLKVAKPARDPHRSIVLQHVSNACRLLILDQRLGVVGNAERRVHHVLAAEDANPAAACDLSTCIRRLQAAGRGIGTRAHGDGREHLDGLDVIAIRALGRLSALQLSLSLSRAGNQDQNSRRERAVTKGGEHESTL